MPSTILRQTALHLFRAWESLVFLLAFAAGFYSLSAAGIVDPVAYAHPVFYGILGAILLLWIVLLDAFGLYSSRRMVSRMNEQLAALGAVTFAAGFLALLGALLGQPTNLAPFLISFLLVGSVLIAVGRFLARIFLRAARARGRNLRFVSIVGAGVEARKLAQDLLGNPQSGYRIAAFFGEPAMPGALPAALGDESCPVRDIAELQHHLMHDPVDEVLIALPHDAPHSEVMSVVERCRVVGVSARIVWAETGPAAIRPSAVEIIGTGTTSLLFQHAPRWGWHGQAKTVMDVTLATLTLAAIAPILLLVAIAIKLDSPGPIFFVQTRVGRNKQRFNLYKFRTMVQNAEALQQTLEAQNEAGGPVFKIRKDPRVTRLGHLLRISSIDELPQLFNVVRGEMSLVGPRPLPLRDVSKFQKDWYSRRFSVKPGLTCSWVLAGRSDLDFDRWVAMDLDYIDNWSLWRDVMICLRTVPVVFRGAGAF